MWGRGGAGNIQQAAEASKQQQQQRGAEDLEAAKPPTTATDPTANNSAAAPQEYAHMGRGGAGNFYSPAALAQTGTFEQPITSTTAEPPPTPLENLDSSSGWWNTATSAAAAATNGEGEQQETPIARTGRGGAGNFVWGGGSERRAEQLRKEWGQLREKQKDVESKVAEDVEKALPPPGKAWLGDGKEPLPREN
ncbi:hypothetical protein GTA08_BOTSDO03442 [Botryosphaeria dothidea]|uniref:Uncharacterized protein n=1 Tax=Botryosphaeria dothidea TaxID=55169 RepID=A0A8H4N3P6_9PEZI|nr:hypothetical protein GTA08_BOTSDO03442 [Botryosphaeria dothidea]